MAERATREHRQRLEAFARFDNPMADTEPNLFCIEALRGLEPVRQFGELDKAQVSERFKSHPELMPNTLADCLYELDYWNQLYVLRHAVDRDAGEGPPESSAREWFVFGLLADIRPRSKVEALAVFRYMISSERNDMTESEAILCNLIS